MVVIVFVTKFLFYSGVKSKRDSHFVCLIYSIEIMEISHLLYTFRFIISNKRAAIYEPS